MTDAYKPVPPAYRGVWMRTLLETPEGIDDTTFVRWMQLSHWHADLRVPLAAQALPNSGLKQCSPAQLALLGAQQGFCGVTEVSSDDHGRELCTWHRQLDYQPPRLTPDTGAMVFEAPDCVVETGVHGVYREVWHRLPGSSGRLIGLIEPERADGLPSARLLLAGRYLMRVAPHSLAGPDFEISFGQLERGVWRIDQSTLPELKRQNLACSIQRSSPSSAQVLGDLGPVNWNILEWTAD